MARHHEALVGRARGGERVRAREDGLHDAPELVGGVRADPARVERVRRGLPLEPVIYGGGQEAGRRAGTENVAYMVALGTACELAQEQLVESQARLRHLRDELRHHLEHSLPGRLSLNGHPGERLPNTLNISVEGIVGEEVLAATPEIASSTGSACHEGSTDPSPVLMAMGQTRTHALGALRLTLGRWSTGDEVEQAARLLARTIDSLTIKQ